MPYIGNQPYQGVIDSGNIVDGSIQTGDLANSAVTAAKIADTGVTVAKLNSDVTQLIAQGGGPKITGVAITNSSWTVLDDTAVDTAGGYIKLTGTNFVTGCSVVVGTTSATAVTFTSSTELRVQLPAQAAGTYILYVTNPDGGTAIRVNAVTYSATPSWVTSSTLPQQDDGVAISIQLSATSATTYALQAGSTLPSGLTLTSGGLLSGTVSGLASDTSYSFTVVATDAELQDSPRAFTVNIAASDTYFNLTTLLINGDTAPNVLTDASSNNFSLTAYGDARASNFTPYGTGWSTYFDGSSYLSISTSSSTLDFGTGDFTIEMWVNPLTQTTSFPSIISCASAWSAGAFYIRYSNTGATNKFGIYWNGVGDPFFVSSSTYPENTWHHVAVTRSGSTVTLWVNGTSAGTGTSSASLNLALGSGVWIGNNASASCNYKGYISNCRIVKGNAVYTANFTPATTNLTAVANTSLLTCHVNRFMDGSTNNFTVTRNGDARVVSFNPFNITNTGVNGSIYLDGTGDYVTTPTSQAPLALDTANFTVECWVYFSSGQPQTNPCILSSSVGSSLANTILLQFGNQPSTQIALWVNNVHLTASATNNNLVFNAWNHIAVCRTGGSTYSFFINGIAVNSVASNSTSLTANDWRLGYWFTGAHALLGYIADFRIIKGTALYSSNFTPPTAPLTAIANTSLLTLQYKQPHNNHSFFDSSTNNHLITRSGNTTQGTFSPFSQTGWGNYFDGASDYLTLASNAAFSFGTGSFTYETWFYSTGTTSAANVFYDLSNANGAGSFSVFTTGGVLYIRIGGTGNDLTYTLTSSWINTWHHLAVVRNGTTLTIYLDGTSVATGTRAQDVTQSTPYIGDSINALAGYSFGGYLSNTRVVKGTAVYTGNFTPPTSPLTAISGTSLLTCQSNRFIDNSTNNFTITRNGDTRVVAFSPFNPTASWSAATYGGSGYFDGSGDYLGFPVSSAFTLGTNDFTIEGWLYPNTLVSGVSTAFVLDSNAYPRVMWYYVGGVFTVHVSTTGAGWDITQTCSVLVNQWNHLVLQRNGNDFRTFLNGSLAATTTASLNIPAQRSVGYVGRGDGGSQIWNGYVSGLRVVNGTAVYNTSGFTPPTSPPTAITNTSLLLNFTNAGIRDATSKNVLETVGDAKISTAQYKFQPSSMAFDGNGDYLFTPSSVDFVFNGDFTIEFWVYRAGSSAGGTGNYECLVATYNGSTGYGVWWLNTTNVLHTRVEGTTADTTTALSNSTWYHVAVTRSGSTVRTFVNGVQGSSLTSSATAANPGLYIGAQTVNKHFNGYIQDFRITKGYARYTANFTPPAQTFKLR